MTDHESRQLLSAITSSFRKHLDSGPQAHDSSSSRPHSFFKGSSDTKSPSSSEHLSSSDSVDSHLNDVLSSPLFSLKPSMISGISSQTIESAKDGVAMKQHNFDPMDWFDEQVALGTATLETAERCLSMNCRRPPGRSSRESSLIMKNSQAGSRVLSWLWASRPGTLQDIGRNVKFSSLLINHLVAENRSDVVWKWIQITRTHPASTELGLRGLFLMALVKAESRFGSGPDAAVKHYLRAFYHILDVVGIEVDMPLSKSHRLNIRPNVRSTQYLKSSGILLRLLFQKPRFHTSTDLFQQFVETLPYWDKHSIVNRARLLLYGHYKPNPSAALKLFRTADMHQSGTLSSSYNSSNDILWNTDALTFGVDTAQALLEQGRYGQATWLVGFLQRNFPDKFELLNDPQRASRVQKFLDCPESFHREAGRVADLFRKLSFEDSPFSQYS